jgi:signal transduction histidine kinase
MPMHSIRVLLIEDNPADVRLIRESLSVARSRQLILEHVPDLDSGVRRLAEPGVDIVLLDLSLPDSQGLDTFESIRRQAPHLPVVILSACDNDDLALHAVQTGAQDYLPKGEINDTLLVRCVRYALERQRTEEQIRALNADLERRVRERTRELAVANQEMEAFSYSVAHDLRRPLRAIDGFSAVLAELCHEKFDAREKDYFGRIRRACQQMDQLIDAILMLTRLSHHELRCERIDLHSLACEVIGELRRRDPARVVDVSIADDLTATGDARLVRIVLENLLGNAWKFTTTRGDPLIEVGARLENGERAFYVRDNGVGFDMSYASKLFTPFERLHTESEFEGLGIGLTTVQRIVRRHGGRMWAEGAIDQGATFYFALQTTEASHHGHRAEDYCFS